MKSENGVAQVYHRDVMVRAQVTLDREMYRRARKRASELGVSFAEYVRRLVALDIPVPQKKADPSILFALGRSNGSDVAANKAVMIAEAFAAKRTSSSHAGRAKRR